LTAPESKLKFELSTLFSLQLGIISMTKHGFCWSMATNLKELIMPIKKGSAAGDKGGKRGTSAPSNKHAQEKMKSGNPTPGAESSKRASQKGRGSKKGSK
jgi:hypothetical protein